MTVRTVLVTGASTGIGRACALNLDRKGFRVFAAVRRQIDADSLRQEASERLRTLILDVTDAEHIAAAQAAVEAAVGEDGLHGLVNNAGIVVSGPVEFLPLDDLRWQLDVNLFGQIAVTQALMPAIRRARGRIVFVGSVGGWLSVPFNSPYSISKYGLEALADSLRQELAPWGIEVSLVKPGAIATPIWDRGVRIAQDLMERLPEAARDLYRDALLRLGAAATATGRGGIPPEQVAAAIGHALTAGRPRTRYLVGVDAKASRLVRLLPDRLRDRLIAGRLFLMARTRAGQEFLATQAAD